MPDQAITTIEFNDKNEEKNKVYFTNDYSNPNEMSHLPNFKDLCMENLYPDNTYNENSKNKKFNQNDQTKYLETYPKVLDNHENKKKKQKNLNMWCQNIFFILLVFIFVAVSVLAYTVKIDIGNFAIFQNCFQWKT